MKLDPKSRRRIASTLAACGPLTIPMAWGSMLGGIEAFSVTSLVPGIVLSLLCAGGPFNLIGSAGTLLGAMLWASYALIAPTAAERLLSWEEHALISAGWLALGFWSAPMAFG